MMGLGTVLSNYLERLNIEEVHSRLQYRRGHLTLCALCKKQAYRPPPGSRVLNPPSHRAENSCSGHNSRFWYVYYTKLGHK